MRQNDAFWVDGDSDEFLQVALVIPDQKSVQGEIATKSLRCTLQLFELAAIGLKIDFEIVETGWR